MEIVVGSCVIRNSTGAVTIEGRVEFILKYGGRDNYPLLSMDIYDVSGDLIAKLANNAWVYNEKERFVLTEEGHHLVLDDLVNRKVVLEICCNGKNQVKVCQGDFFSHTGKHIQIHSEQLTINGRPACSLNCSGSEQLTFDIEQGFAS